MTFLEICTFSLILHHHILLASYLAICSTLIHLQPPRAQSLCSSSKSVLLPLSCVFISIMFGVRGAHESCAWTCGCSTVPPMQALQLFVYFFGGDVEEERSQTSKCVLFGLNCLVFLIRFLSNSCHPC